MVADLSWDEFQRKLEKVREPEAYCKLFILMEILAVLGDIEVLLGQSNMRDIYE